MKLNSFNLSEQNKKKRKRIFAMIIRGENKLRIENWEKIDGLK